MSDTHTLSKKPEIVLLDRTSNRVVYASYLQNQNEPGGTCVGYSGLALPVGERI
jgi:hypothetical protein